MTRPRGAPRLPRLAGPSGWRRLGWTAGGIALVGLFAALRAVAPRAGYEVPAADRPVQLIVAIWAGAGIIYVATMALFWRGIPIGRGGLAWIGAVGVAMRAAMFVSVPMFEDDYYRYQWDGAVVSQGVSPYLWSPLEVGDGNAPQSLIELAYRAPTEPPVLERISYPSMRSIYPPVSELVFGLAHRVAPWNPLGLRAVFLLFDAATAGLVVLALARLGRPTEWVALYWWCPIVAKSFVNGIHLDPIAVFFAMASVTLLLHHRIATAYAALALAAGAKMWPIILTPLFIRYTWRHRRATVVGVITMALLLAVTFVPYLWQHRGETSGFVRYMRDWENNTAHVAPLTGAWAQVCLALDIDPGHARRFARWTLATVVALWILALGARPIPDARHLVRRCTLAVGGLFVLSPTQFPWYYGWVVPFLALDPWWPLLAYAVLLPLYHLHYAHAGVVWIEHAPVWVLLTVDGLRRAARRGTSTSVPGSAGP